MREQEVQIRCLDEEVPSEETEGLGVLQEDKMYQ